MRRIHIIGAGGHAKVVLDALQQKISPVDYLHTQILFYSDYFEENNDSYVLPGYPVVGKVSTVFNRVFCGDSFIVAFGDNRKRIDILEKLKSFGLLPMTVIHPKANISSHCEIGSGSVVMAGATIQACAKIGLGSIINTGATVDHDCVLEKGVHICPGAHLAGDVRVGECTQIGIGASVKQGIRIGPYNTVGAGAAVIGSFEESGFTIVGVPASRI